MRRFAAACGATAAVWAALQFHHSTRDDPLDGAIAAGTSLVFGCAAVVMLAGTRRWSARAVGLFLTSLGLAVATGLGTYLRLVSHGTALGGTPERVNDLARACYVVGGPLLAAGLAAWVWANWRPTEDVSPDDTILYHGHERRKRERRRNWPPLGHHGGES